MSYYFCDILPGLESQLFREVDLAHEYETNFKRSGDSTKEKEMQDLGLQEELLKYVQDKYEVSYTLGGYLEDRSLLWADFEKDSKKMIHLGVDVNNLTPGQPVSLPRLSSLSSLSSLPRDTGATVFHVLRDTSEHNGWGGRLIFKLDNSYRGCDYLLYGHLSYDLPEVGTHFSAGDIVGYLGESQNNGGWFVHLHVQLVKQAMIDMYAEDLRNVDGYLLDKDGALDESQISADPTLLICRAVL